MDTKSELNKLAAEMALCKMMPSPYYDDWGWPKNMPVSAWVKVERSALEAEDRCKEWATRLREMADATRD